MIFFAYCVISVLLGLDSFAAYYVWHRASHTANIVGLEVVFAIIFVLLLCLYGSISNDDGPSGPNSNQDVA